MKTIDAMYSRSLLQITLIFESTTLLLVCFIINIHLCKFVQLAEIDIFLFIYQHILQGSKLTLANSQNVSDFDNLRVRKISTSKRLRVRIIHVSQTKGNKLLVVSPVCQWKKILLAKLCKCTKKITSSPVLVPLLIELMDQLGSNRGRLG